MNNIINAITEALSYWLKWISIIIENLDELIGIDEKKVFVFVLILIITLVMFTIKKILK